MQQRLFQKTLDWQLVSAALMGPRHWFVRPNVKWTNRFCGSQLAHIADSFEPSFAVPPCRRPLGSCNRAMAC